jgi:hypothetical protein
VDELMFFSHGKFTSARTPMVSGVQASSSDARIYYGHGQMVPYLTTVDANHPEYKKPYPRIDDGLTPPNGPNGTRADMATRAAAGLGMAPYDDTNPNAFASNWTLLRHVTLLCKPSTSDVSPVPPTVASVYGLNPANSAQHVVFRNKYTQVALEPAMSSIFRSVATYWAVSSNYNTPFNNPDDMSLRATSDGALRLPISSSGLVDIASTDLDEIRATVLGGADFASRTVIRPDLITSTNLLPLISTRDFLPGRVAGFGLYPTRPPTSSYNDLDRMQAWMQDAMPTDSRNQKAATAGQDIPKDVPDTLGTRIRYEANATDLLASMQLPATATGVQQLKQAEDRADQLMLAASNFVPHCSEFIVEWSYGDVDSLGLVVWHGPNRRTDTNSDGKIDANDGIAVRPYPYDMGTSTTPPGAHVKSFHVGDVVSDFIPAAQPPIPVSHPVTDRLIYGFSPTGDEACLTSYFGWTDPTYDPTFVPSPLPANTHYVRAAQSVPWAWPRMIRVTITLSDPLEPEIESTFQYIFNTPDDAGHRGGTAAGSAS